MTLIELYDRRDWLQYATVEGTAGIAVYPDRRTITLTVPRWHSAFHPILKYRGHTAIRYANHVWDVEKVDVTHEKVKLTACRYAFDQLTEPWTFDSYLAARTTKENPMPDTIDPTTCKPGEMYRVRTGSGDEYVGERVDPEDHLQWRLNRPASVWVRDVDVTVLHRLVPEPEEKTLDVPMQPWDTLRAAADLLDTRAVHGFLLLQCRKLADRLEAEHRAAQEKAEQDAAREALIEKAADAYNRAAEAQAARAPLGDRDTAPWRDGIRAVIDTVLAEAVES